MSGTGWKGLVQGRHGDAVVWARRDPATGGQVFTCYEKRDGRELGTSTVSKPDAWRVAWVNIREGVPADKAPGQSLLL